MARRVLPAASVLLWAATAAAPSLAQTPRSPGTILITTAVRQDGTRYLFEIPQERADKLPAWDQRSTPEPPLSISAAKKAGEAWLLSRSTDVKTFEMASLFLVPFNPGNAPGGSCRPASCWFYRLVFDPVISNRRLNGGGDFTVVVLLDGSIVEPRVDDGPAPAQTTAGSSTAATQPAAPAAGAGPIRIGGGLPPPRQTKRVNPVYPPDAQGARIQGVVIIEATIGIDGKVQATKILRSIPELDRAAIDAVTQWEYTPTLVNGVPVAVIMTVTVNFSLQ